MGKDIIADALDRLRDRATQVADARREHLRKIWRESAKRNRKARREYRRAWYRVWCAKNREKERKRWRDSAKKNRERRTRYAREWRIRNPRKTAAYRRAFKSRQKNKITESELALILNAATKTKSKKGKKK